MEFDIIYPEDKAAALDAECVIAAVFFDEKELIGFGVDSDSLELNDEFYNYNQLEKPFELWSSPLYLSDFYKLKQGTIIGHYPFRFYAIEIEEKKCYLITGATIKVHKDMKKADNTKIELHKLEYTLQYIKDNGLDTKNTFVINAL